MPSNLKNLHFKPNNAVRNRGVYFEDDEKDQSQCKFDDTKDREDFVDSGTSEINCEMKMREAYQIERDAILLGIGRYDAEIEHLRKNLEQLRQGASR